MSFDWDEILVTKDADAKQLEVSFKKVTGENIGSDNDEDYDPDAPGNPGPCLLWRGTYISSGLEILKPQVEFRDFTTAEDMLEGNPYSVKVEIDVYDDSLEYVNLEWADASGTHTKRTKVIANPDGANYVDDVIEWSMTEAQAQAMEGTVGVHELGSVAITDTYTECTQQLWYSYFSSGNPCVQTNQPLTAVGDRPIPFSVSGCFLPPPDPDPDTDGGDDIVDPPPECNPIVSCSDGQAWLEEKLDSGYWVSTDPNAPTPDPLQHVYLKDVMWSAINVGDPCPGTLYVPTISECVGDGVIGWGSRDPFTWGNTYPSATGSIIIADLDGNGNPPTTGTKDLTIYFNGFAHYTINGLQGGTNSTGTITMYITFDYDTGYVSINGVKVGEMENGSAAGAIGFSISYYSQTFNDNPGGEFAYIRTTYFIEATLSHSSFGYRKYYVQVNSQNAWEYDGQGDAGLNWYATGCSSGPTPLYAIAGFGDGTTLGWQQLLKSLGSAPYQTVRPDYCERLP